jgi:predicted porin
MVGAAYDFQVVKFFGQYQQMMTSATERIVNHVYQAGFTIKFNPANFLSASYVKAHANGIALNRDTWAIGYDYFASKRTDLYVAFLRDTATMLAAL